MPEVLVIDSTYEEAYQKLEPILKSYLPRISSKDVLIKPNLLAGAPPDRVICTHPVLIKAVCDILIKSGKKVRVSDNPGVSGYGSSIRAARESGLLDLIGDLFENPAVSPRNVSVESRFTDHFFVSGNILEAGFVINMPKLKTHSLTLLSGAIKNMFGILVGGEKVRAHSLGRNRDEFAELLIDIYNIRIPELTIMDAIWAMEGSGPSNGKKREVNKILISDNGFAVDAVCAGLMGLEPQMIPYLKVAIRRGLLKLEDIKIIGEAKGIKGFKIPPTFHKENISGRAFISFVNSFIFKRILSGPARLKLDKKACVRCNVCVRQCPAGAMEIGEGNFPYINESKCIGCYCCDELCPKHAWGYKGIMRIIGR